MVPDVPPPSSVRGQLIRSESQPGVSYLLERVMREGGMGVSYLAQRIYADGVAPVVLRMMKPQLGQGRISAEVVAAKEAVALGRLNECVPPTPFVVRMLDAGTLEMGSALIPWNAVEYVHGGVEGTTLQERVTYSVNKTGYAFTPERVAHLLRCLSSGLTAVHGVQVTHRDLSPNNVLCCGFGETEIFKISDFGVARAGGLDFTFGGVFVGTLGYSAPEAAEVLAGPRSDVFSLACIIYFALTGQHYFDAPSPLKLMKAIMATQRVSIFDHATLHPDLQYDTRAGGEIDAALAAATHLSPEQRPATPREFLRSLSEALPLETRAPRSSASLVAAVAESPKSWGRFSWVVRSKPKPGQHLKAAAWDADGHAFALTANGAKFWNGHTWLDASAAVRELASGLQFVSRYEAGGWLVGGAGPTLSVLTTDGLVDQARPRDSDVSFSAASGRLGDLLVAIGAKPEEPEALWTLSGRRWLRPLHLPEVERLCTLSRISDERWIVGGVALDGTSYAAIVSPLQQTAERIELIGAGSVNVSTALSERGLAMVTSGSRGVYIEGALTEAFELAKDADVTAAALDVHGRRWLGSHGRLWTQTQDGRWIPPWIDPSWTSPFCALWADAGMVSGLSADGGVVEGRIALE